MKRTLVALLLVAALAAPAFGQNIGSTWYDPQSATTFIPSSFPNFYSNGIFADEIDYIFRSPINLGDYEGYSVYTAYGNYGLLPGDTAIVNPFTTAAISTGAGTIGSYQVAAAFPVLGFRAGAMLGHLYTLSGNLTGAGDPYENEGGSRIVTDANTLGTADYTETTAYASTAKITTSATTALAGVSLGDIGASFLIASSGTSRLIGGSNSYTWAAGTDAAYLLTLPGSSTPSTTSTYVGYGEDGKAKNFNSTANLFAEAVGQYKLGDLPLIASVGFNSKKNALGLTQVKADYSETVLYDDTYGAAGAATDSSTYTMSYGQSLAAAWSMSTLSPTWDNEPDPYIDAANSKDTGFDLFVSAGAEPIFAVNDVLTFKTRALLDIANESTTDATALLAASTASLANTAEANSTWTYGYSSTDSTKGNVFTLGFELGGMAEFSDPSGFITLGAGAFLQPAFGFGTTTYANAVERIDRAYVDSVNTNPVTIALAQAADDIDLDTASELIGTYEGSSVNTTTTTYADKGSTNTVALDIRLPTAVKLSFKEGKFAAIFGYTMVHSSKVTTTTTPDSVTTQVVTLNDGTSEIYNSTNATHYPDAVDLNATTTTAGTKSVTTSSVWNGQMGWCFRWVPTESLTIDLTGATIMNALDGIGLSDFMLDDILSSLGISATFRF